MLRLPFLLIIAYICSSLVPIAEAQNVHHPSLQILIIDSIGNQSSDLITNNLYENLKQTSAIKICKLSKSNIFPKLFRRNRRLYDLVVYIGQNYTERIAKECIGYIKAGGRFWYIGDKAPFSGSCSKFSDIKRIRMQFYSRIFMRGAKDVWTEFPQSSFVRKPTPTKIGLDTFGEVIKDYCKNCIADKITVLQTRSGHLPWLRPSCNVVDYANGIYRRSNWCGRRGDTTKGIALAMIKDNCIEYGASRTLLTSFRALYQLSDDKTKFAKFVRTAISLLCDTESIIAIAPESVVTRKAEKFNFRMRIGNYSDTAENYNLSVFAINCNSKQRIPLCNITQQVAGKSDMIISQTVAAKKIPPGLYKLSAKLQTNGKTITDDCTVCILNATQPVSRENFWKYPAVPRFLITFRDYGLFPGNGIKAIEAGQDGVVLMIPWQPNGKDIKHAVNWSALDRWVKDARKNGLKVIFDAWDHRPYPEYFVHFSKKTGGSWYKYISVVVDENREKWAKLWSYLLKRYMRLYPDSIAGIFLTPAAISSFRIDYSPQASDGFRKYLLSKYSLAQLSQRWNVNLSSSEDISPPDINQPQGKVYQQILDYHEFWLIKHRQFLRASADAIRKVSAAIPLLLRGPYDAGPGFRDAASLIPAYGKISIHAENVETTTHRHIEMFGYHLRYSVPITAENGWPACRGEPLRSAFYKTLMGDYSAYLYSGGASFQLLPNEELIARFAYLSNQVKSAIPVANSVAIGVLINETTQCVQRTGLKLNRKYEYPDIKMNLFRLSYPMMAVSIAKPKLTGLKFLIDGGNNVVVAQKTLDSILKWVSDGGTFITFPKFAIITEAGTGKSFVQKLLSESEFSDSKPTIFLRYKDMTVSRIAIGRGSILVINSISAERAKLSGNLKKLLSRIPWKIEYDSGTFDKCLDRLFKKLKVYKPVGCNPYIPLAVKRISPKKWYVIMYDVDPKIVGGYFSYDDMINDANPPIKGKKRIALTLTFPWKISAARDISANESVIIKDNTIQLHLPRANGKILYVEGR